METIMSIYIITRFILCLMIALSCVIKNIQRLIMYNGSPYVVFSCGPLVTEFTRILQPYNTVTVAILRLLCCQWTKPYEYKHMEYEVIS